MRPNPRPQETYRHFKGGIYQIRCLAKHSETGETMVVYQAMYAPFQIYVRPLAMFMEEVDRARYPEAKQRYRFELLTDAEDMAAADAARPARNSEVPAVHREIQTHGEASRRQEEFSRQAKDREAALTAETSRQPERAAEAEEELHIDPLVMEFLDADTYEQRLHILAALRDRVTDDMINTMAVAVDLEIKDGGIEERYEELRNCLLTFEKYECNRLR